MTARTYQPTFGLWIWQWEFPKDACKKHSVRPFLLPNQDGSFFVRLMETQTKEKTSTKFHAKGKTDEKIKQLLPLSSPIKRVEVTGSITRHHGGRVYSHQD